MLLVRRSSGMERFLPALSTASIDLHPHQVDAAVFASRSPYRDGVILADEEGLGKTIEAGIALLQAWLEDRKRLLVLCPPALIDHWQNELADKFDLPIITIEDVTANDGVVVLSHQKAAKSADELAQIPWDICILDDAHLLANAGLSEHVQANAIRVALRDRPKLLLTATPMQNSLLDLYHLIRFIDDTTFADDPEDFRARYMAKKAFHPELAERAQVLCQRTLRRQAVTMPEIRRTVRTIQVAPSQEEEALSRRLSLYFHRDKLVAFPKVKEHHIRLTYWKMLASSPRALQNSLTRLCDRLGDVPEAADELNELRAITAMAAAIPEGTRAKEFIKNLTETRSQSLKAGAPDKAVVFSENTDTLDFLRDLLTRHGYECIPYHGGNRSKRALLDFTRSGDKILLTTDGGARGLDLSHCALVVNYDLPWNMQKLEQRISRCHRYGQKHDVLVLNFIDPSNRADRRLYDSLNKKLKCFDDLFGASDTLLGTLTTDDEAPPELRSSDEILTNKEATAEKRQPEIQARVEKAEADLLAHMDAEVRRRFARYGETVPAALSNLNFWLWELTKYRLRHHATFNDMGRSFVLTGSPYPDLRLSRITFGMDRSLPPGERYHLGHPLARRVLADNLTGEFGPGSLTLKASGKFKAGMSGELGLWRFGMMSDVAQVTEPILCGVTDAGKPLSHDQCAGLLALEPLSHAGGPRHSQDEPPHSLRNPKLDTLRDQALAVVRDRLTVEHDSLLQTELDRLRQWAEDEDTALKARQEELRRRIVEAKARSEKTAGYVQRFRTNQQAAELEKERRREEERLFLLAAEVRRKRDVRIEEARRKSTLRFWDEEMFVVKFKVVDNTGLVGTNLLQRHGGLYDG